MSDVDATVTILGYAVRVAKLDVVRRREPIVNALVLVAAGAKDDRGLWSHTETIRQRAGGYGTRRGEQFSARKRAIRIHGPSV